MNHSERIQQNISTVGVRVLSEECRLTFNSTGGAIKGSTLAQLIAHAMDLRERLDKCIESMSQALDSGETQEERIARIAAEDADPKTAAEARGWYAIEDFTLMCDAGKNGFRNRISSVRGAIVRPRDMNRLLGSTWAEYPARSEFYGDHFDFADNWAEALAKARKEEARKRQEAV